nr:sigma 54-interacting transcriptional regulator [Biomaibacter acetigenes]
MAVDSKGNITYFNRKAQEMFDMDAYDTTDRHINKIIPYGVFNMDIDLHDRNNVELNLFEGKKRISMLMNTRIIKNEEGAITGALIILNKMEEVRQMIQSVSGPSMIDFEDIIGQSQALKNAITLARSVAPSNSTIMLRGESGTGKELFARAIHMSSRRSKYPFVAINCAAVPDSLLESEFSGMKRVPLLGPLLRGSRGYSKWLLAAPCFSTK